jgi:hypothetical protein
MSWFLQDYECRDADDMFGLGPLNKFGARGGVRSYTIPIGLNHV